LAGPPVLTLRSAALDRVPDLTRMRPRRSAISGCVVEVILCDVSEMALLSSIPHWQMETNDAQTTKPAARK
jgi:hypothetical protein